MEVEDTQTSASGDPSESGAELEAAARTAQQREEDIERMAQMPNLAVVFSAGSVDEGEIIRALLEGEGIPAIYNDLSSPTLGEVLSVSRDHAGDVLVAQADLENAKALIESYRNATVTDDMVGEDASESEE